MPVGGELLPERETLVILVRHGTTAWNRCSRYQGRLDIPINEEGLAQSRALSRVLSRVSLAAVYTSPLSRASDCARIVAAAHGLKPIYLPGIIEICHGDWEGMLLSEVEDKYTDLLTRWRTLPYTVRMPRGESLAEVEERAWAALEKMIHDHPGGTVAAVTHDTPIRTILRRVLGLDQSHFWRIRLDNTGINILGWRNDIFRVIVLNDTCHLGGWMQAGEQKAL